MAGIEIPGGLFGKVEIDEDSGVPLSDWKGIINKGTAKLEASSAFNTTTTIYTVPAGKHFYLVSAQLVGQNSVAGGANTALFGLAAGVILRAHCRGASEHTEVSLTFPVPLKFSAGSAFLVSGSGGDLVAYVSLMGYEI